MSDFTELSFFAHDINEDIDISANVEEINTTMLAKDMYPNRKVWEELGFVFIYIPGEDDLYSAIMPEGWFIKSSDCPRSDIFDENGMHRGALFYNGRTYMKLFNRYKVFEEVTEDSLTKSIYFGNKDEKLFCAGEVCFSDNLSYEEKEAKCIEVNELWDLAMKFANENYPDWTDVGAYWDLINDKEKGTAK